METQAMQQNTSQNVLIKQIIQKYLQWDRFAEGIAMIPIPKNILQTMGHDMTATDIDLIVESVKPIIKDSVMFMKGKYDLKRCIETLEDYMQATGMQSDHRIQGSLHHFIAYSHGLGKNLVPVYRAAAKGDISRVSARKESKVPDYRYYRDYYHSTGFGL